MIVHGATVPKHWVGPRKMRAVCGACGRPAPACPFWKVVRRADRGVDAQSTDDEQAEASIRWASATVTPSGPRT